MIESRVPFQGLLVTMRCDGQCDKAFGIADRPIDPAGDYVKDRYLGESNAEGRSYAQSHVPWCRTDCERSVIGDRPLPDLE